MPTKKQVRSWYIAIEGVIGVGKTTLARMLKKQFDAGLLLEVFEENPFLTKFYEDRIRYAFQTQMFFLLSRYRQQRHRIQEIISQGPLISDYMFAKDQLFARLNLAGDEWEMYQRIHTALSEQIPAPQLIVYLEADLDILMARIAQRDRPYERNMDRSYIELLRQTYENYFSHYTDGPVLTINTNQLDYVTNPGDLNLVVNRIRSTLHEGAFQRPLPQFEKPLPPDNWLDHGNPLPDLQRFHIKLDQEKHFNTDPYFNYILLNEEMGELGSEFAKLWLEENALVVDGNSPPLARQIALDHHRSSIESELADCMAYLLKLANYAGVDLETAYLEKMLENQSRNWASSQST